MQRIAALCQQRRMTPAKHGTAVVAGRYCRSSASAVPLPPCRAARLVTVPPSIPALTAMSHVPGSVRRIPTTARQRGRQRHEHIKRVQSESRRARHHASLADEPDSRLDASRPAAGTRTERPDLPLSRPKAPEQRTSSAGLITTVPCILPCGPLVRGLISCYV